MKDNCLSCSKFVRLLILAFLLALVSACGGGSSNSAASSNEQVLKTTTGVAQKGPFSLNSPVVISRLDSVGNPTGDTISTKISTKTGGFEFEIPEQWDDSNSALINYYIEVQGKAFDESSGTQSSTSISLTAYTQNINSSSVNLLTYWHAERAKQLLAEGKSFKQSIKQANDELVKLFGIDQINSLDISSSEFASDSAMLLLLSGALMDVARAHEVEPQLLIDEISDDFSSDGELSASGDHWFLRMQAIIRDNPSAHANKYSKLLKEKQTVSTVAVSNLPAIIPLASRPVANVPSELFASPGETITLGGSASHDSGNIINFTWFRVDQQTQYPVPVSDRFAASPTITVPSEAEVLAAPNQEIVLLYALVVTDQDKLTHTGVVKVIIKIPLINNTPPVAEPQQLVTDEDIPLKITLDGSDAEGDPISFNLNTPQSLAHGILELDPDLGSALPNVVYTPTKDYFGSDSFIFLINDGFENSNIATIDIQVNPVNDPPIAHAGVDQIAESLQTIMLNGLNSTDVDGTVDTYLWQQQPGGSVVSLDDATISNPSFTAPDVSSVSEMLTFNLVVTDNDGVDSIIADTVEIVVNPPSNIPPIADDITIPIDPLGYETFITLMGDDPDGNNANLTYEIITLPNFGGLNVPVGPIASNSNDVEYLSYSVPSPDIFTYRVIDEQGLISNEAIVSLSVPNIPPVAIATLNQQPPYNEGAQLQLIGGESFDQGGIIVSYLWEQISLPTVILSDPADPNPTFTLPGVITAPLILSFTLTVTDNDGAVSSDTIDIPVNGQPIATPQDVTLEFSTLDIVLSGTDPEGGALNYKIVTLPTNGTISGISVNVPFTSPTITYIPGNTPVADSFTFATIDDEGFVSTLATVNILVGNSPPTANPQQVVLDVNVSYSITFNLTGSDPDGDSFTFEIVEVLTPPNAYSFTQGTSFINDGEVTFEVFDFAGDFNFTFKVIDQHGLSSNIATVSIMVGNNTPNATTQSLIIPSVNGLEVDLHNYSSDPDGDVITFELVGTPIENTLNIIFSPTFATDGIATFVPLDTPASGSFQYKVIDEHGDESSIGTISASTP